MERGEPTRNTATEPEGPDTPIRIKIKGIWRLSLKAAAEACGLPYERVRWRYKMKGWTLEQALELAPMPKRYVRRRSWASPATVETWTSPRVEQQALPRVEEIYLPRVEERARGPVSGRAPTSRCIPVTVEGIAFRSRMAAARYYKIDPMLFNKRLMDGWAPEEAAGLKRRPGTTSPIAIAVAGMTFKSLKAAAEARGLSYMTVYQRFAKRNWTLEQALELKPRP